MKKMREKEWRKYYFKNDSYGRQKELDRRITEILPNRKTWDRSRGQRCSLGKFFWVENTGVSELGRKGLTPSLPGK